MDVPSRYSLKPMQVPNATFEKPLFERIPRELRLMGDFNGLPDAFTMEELRAIVWDSAATCKKPSVAPPCASRSGNASPN